MTAYQTAGASLVAVALALLIPTAVQRIRRHRARRLAAVRRHEWADAKLEAELRRVIDQRDRYCGLYHDAVKRNAALLEHIGDEREAEAVQALADSPAYFDAMAAREAATIDSEWFDLSGDER